MSLLLGIVGLPIPDETLMTFIGYNVSQGILAFIPSLLSAFAGAVLGSTINYMLGLKLGLPFLKKVGPRIFISELKIARAQFLFHKYGHVIIFASYFIPGVRHLSAYMAGISGIHFRKFCLLAYSGALVWCVIFIGLGQILGENWFRLNEYLQGHLSYLVVGGGMICMSILLFVRLKIKKRSRMR